MKNLKFIFILLLFSHFALAQNQQVNKEELEKVLNPVLQEIESMQYLKREVSVLQSKLNSAQHTIDSLKIEVEENKIALQNTENQIQLKISENASTSNQKFESVSQSISKKSLWAIIGILLAIVISGIVYWLLSRKQKTDKKEIVENLNNTKNRIEENLVKEFVKQTSLLETQLQLIEEQNKNQSTKSTNPDIDHSLALKLCDQINQMENNLNKMDQDVKGIKSLRKSIGNLKDNLVANGYEMPELIGKMFNQGMNLIVISSVPDDNLNKGDEVISKIIKPQINFKGIMIQAAQVEVSIG